MENAVRLNYALNLRTLLNEVTKRYENPLGYPCLLAKLAVCEQFMLENTVDSVWRSYGRGSARYITNEIRFGLIKNKWKDGSCFHDAPLFYGWSLKQIEDRFRAEDADSIPERVAVAYSHYQKHKNFKAQNE